MNEEDGVSVELQPGQASMHHGHLFHASGPNTGDRRIGSISYIKTSMKQLRRPGARRPCQRRGPFRPFCHRGTAERPARGGGFRSVPRRCSDQAQGPIRRRGRGPGQALLKPTQHLLERS